METLGDKIKHLRGKLTQEELAVILQVDRSTLASWEVNRREPDIATLCLIASFFHVTIDWLVGRTMIPSAASQQLQESGQTYRSPQEESWHKVIVTAQRHGVDADTVCQLIRVHAKIAKSLHQKTQ